MELLIFGFDFELWQILFSHTLLCGNLNNAVLTNKGGHCIGDCTPTHDRGQSEVNRSR